MVGGVDKRRETPQNLGWLLTYQLLTVTLPSLRLQVVIVLGIIFIFEVSVAQWLRRQVVALEIVGSNPTVHPYLNNRRQKVELSWEPGYNRDKINAKKKLIGDQIERIGVEEFFKAFLLNPPEEDSSSRETRAIEWAIAFTEFFEENPKLWSESTKRKASVLNPEGKLPPVRELKEKFKNWLELLNKSKP